MQNGVFGAYQDNENSTKACLSVLSDQSLHCPPSKGLAKEEHITKTHLYNSDPLKPHIYIVKLGLFFLFLLKNID